MSVAKSSFIFSAGTLLSRFSGVIRDSVIGAVFGASAYMDAFVIAFRIPNLLRELLAEGALGSSFTKVYASLCVEHPEDATKLLVQTLQFIAFVSIFICTVGMVCSSQLVNLMTSAQDTARSGSFHDITASLTMIMFPFIGFASIGAIFQGALFQRGQFFLVGMSPIFMNGLSVVGALWLAPLALFILPFSVTRLFSDPNILGLALGTILGGAAQSGVQAWGLWKPILRQQKFWPTVIPWSPDLKKVIVLMAPMVIAASAGQINVVVNTNFATSLGTGPVTWLNFAFRIVQLPIGMFGVAVGAAVLPTLTKSITEAHGKVDKKASQDIINAMDLVAWLMIPCTMAMAICSQDLTRLLYEAGRFTPSDTLATSLAIEAYSYGLFGYGMLKVMNSYYYATGRTKFPMMVSLISIAGNYIANRLLVHQFGHRGLAVTASIMLTLNASLLVLGMTKDHVQVDWRQIRSSLTWLVAGILTTVLFHQFVENFLFHMTLGSLLPKNSNFLPNIFVKKFDSVLRIGINAGMIALVFGSMGLTRIKKTPKDAWRMLRRHK